LPTLGIDDLKKLDSGAGHRWKTSISELKSTGELGSKPGLLGDDEATGFGKSKLRSGKREGGDHEGNNQNSRKGGARVTIF